MNFCSFVSMILIFFIYVALDISVNFVFSEMLLSRSRVKLDLTRSQSEVLRCLSSQLLPGKDLRLFHAYRKATPAW